MHWLVNVLRRTGTPGADVLTIGTDTPAVEAWAAVQQHCGVSEDELVRLISAHTGLPVADLSTAELTARRLIPDRIAQRYGVVPLRETDRQIVVATSDPTNLEAEQAISFAAGRRVAFEIASPAVLHAALAVPIRQRAVAPTPGIGIEAIAATRGGTTPARSAPAAGPAVSAAAAQRTEHLLSEAIRSGATDVQLEPGPEHGTIRLRIDGVYRRYAQLPIADLDRILTRLKTLTRLATAVHHRPQEGHARIRAGGAEYDIYVATIPTREGERATVRISYHKPARTLDELQVSPAEVTALRQLTTARDGLILIAGSPGSGRTVTAYAMLRELLDHGVRVTTIEDPVEYTLPAATQIQVDVRTGLTFAAALRTAAGEERAAIFVGEIRDPTTADAAMQAVGAGHLVLGGLQASSAVGAIERLAEFGLSRARIAAAVRGIIAQHLVRRVCGTCAQRVDVQSPNEQQLARALGTTSTISAHGCANCGQTGYRGRMPIMEIVPATPAVVDAITNAGATMYRQISTAAVRSMRHAASERVRRGETTLAEVERVLGSAVHGAISTAERPLILVAEDDAVERRLACAVLEQHGFRTAEAIDGMAAIEQLADAGPFAAAILDLRMPRLDGRQVLERIRQKPETAMLPVIVLTILGDVATEVALIDAGADDYLAKPIDPPRFIARIKAAIRRAAA